MRGGPGWGPPRFMFAIFFWVVVWWTADVAVTTWWPWDYRGRRRFNDDESEGV